MKVHGFSDEITTCDCCGKSNLSGTFAVETEAGDVLHYGSVCVRKVYGKKRAASIVATGRAIASVQALEWSAAINKLARGYHQPLMAYIGNKPAWNNSTALLSQADSIRDPRTGVIVKQRAAA